MDSGEKTCQKITNISFIKEYRISICAEGPETLWGTHTDQKENNFEKVNQDSGSLNYYLDIASVLPGLWFARIYLLAGKLLVMFFRFDTKWLNSGDLPPSFRPHRPGSQRSSLGSGTLTSAPRLRTHCLRSRRPEVSISMMMKPSLSVSIICFWKNFRRSTYLAYEAEIQIFARTGSPRVVLKALSRGSAGSNFSGLLKMSSDSSISATLSTASMRMFP